MEFKQVSAIIIWLLLQFIYLLLLSQRIILLDGFLTHDDFLHWWAENLTVVKFALNSSLSKSLRRTKSIISTKSMRNSMRADSIYSIMYNFDERKRSTPPMTESKDLIHLLGMLEAERNKGNPFNKYLLRAEVPKLAHARAYTPPDYFASVVEDWNELYQRSVEEAYLAQTKVVEIENSGSGKHSVSDIDVFEKKSVGVVSNTSTIATVRGSSHKEILEKSLNVIAIKAAFYNTILKGSFLCFIYSTRWILYTASCSVLGAKTIVDEYTLPDNMKSITPMFFPTPPEMTNTASFDKSNLFSSYEDLPNTGNMLFYESNGLVFHFLSMPLSEEDFSPDEKRAVSVIATETLLSKVAGNNYRARLEMQRAINSMYTDSLMDRNWNLANKDIPHNNGEVDSEILVKPCTLMSAIVDYAGFRLVAYSPVFVEEAATLVNGLSRVENLYVDALPSFRSCVPRLAEKLNIQTQEKIFSVSTVTLSANNPTSTTASVNSIIVDSAIDYITEELQAHVSSDGRLYVLNCDSMLLADLPRADSNDYYIKKLRPEFLQAQTFPIAVYNYSTALRNVAKENKREESLEHKNGESEVSCISNIQYTINIAKNLYQNCLPDAAKALDSLVEMPLESYGLKQFLHRNGISCRHIGILYFMCKAPFVRQLLLCEAVARCCKVIYLRMLREMAREAKAESMIAERRERSRQADFIEQMDYVHNRRKEVCLELYNGVLGCGKHTDTFWEGKV